jgi:hypothetical protein
MHDILLEMRTLAGLAHQSLPKLAAQGGTVGVCDCCTAEIATDQG